MTNLQTALDAKASNADLSSLEAEVTKDLQAVNTALEGKANSSHTHTVSQITDMPNVVLSVNAIKPSTTGDVSLGLHAVATSGDYNDLTNKPRIPATPKAYITETWKNGSNWYRKWSDGLIEQGGVLWVDAPYQTMTFNTPFSNTDYSISGWFGPDPWGDRYPVMLVVGFVRKPESFKLYVGYDRDDNYTGIFSGGTTIYWSAVGC